MLIILYLSLVTACTRQREPAPPAAATDSGAPAAAPAAQPADTSSGADTIITVHDTASVQWTVGRTHGEREVNAVAIMRAVRTAGHDDFDRIVFDFGNDALPSFTIEYVDRPVRACGSGDPVPMRGDAWLRIEFTPAYAHTEEGQPTISIRSLAPNLPNLKELKLTCDFEAYVEWVGGLASPNPYRVIQLHTPTRLVVDVRSARR